VGLRRRTGEAGDSNRAGGFDKHAERVGDEIHRLQEIVLAAGSHGIVTFEIGNDGTLTHTSTQTGVPVAAAGIAVR
jgi:hypothetical protein